MGRMFRIITDGETSTPPAPNRGTVPTMNPYASEPIPFVEVGGPEGVITSHARPPRPAPLPRIVTPPPAPEPVRYTYASEPVRYAPPPVVDPKMLSVAFHKMPKPGLRVLPPGIAPEVVAYHHPDHPVSAEYRLVRDEIRRQFDAPQQRTILFTSGTAAAGTTTVTLNVAVAMAQDQQTRVLVVDGNPQRPSIAARMGVADAPGLADVLSQAVPLAWAIQTTAVVNLHVLAGGAATERTAGLVPQELPRLLAQVRQWFDWVMVDVGVWERTFGAHTAAGTGDAVYLVSRHTDLERMEFHTLRGSVGPNLCGYITTRH